MSIDQHGFRFQPSTTRYIYIWIGVLDIMYMHVQNCTKSLFQNRLGVSLIGVSLCIRVSLWTCRCFRAGGCPSILTLRTPPTKHSVLVFPHYPTGNTCVIFNLSNWIVQQLYMPIEWPVARRLEELGGADGVCCWGSAWIDRIFMRYHEIHLNKQIWGVPGFGIHFVKTDMFEAILFPVLQIICLDHVMTFAATAGDSGDITLTHYIL